VKQPIIALDARCIGNRNTGDTTYWTGLLHGLFNSKNKFQYLLFSNAPRPPEIPESERLRWVELKASSSRWWSLVAFPLAARKAGASILHTQYTLSPLAVNGITTIHDVSFFVGPNWFKPKDRFLLQKSVPPSARRASRVITVSETSKRDILKYIPIPENKVAVTHLAPALGIRHVQNPDLSKLGIEKPFILTVGTRWPRKNMQLALDAVELLPDSLLHKLIVTGQPGWGEETYGKRAKASGWVTNEELSHFYSAADLYLVPSRYEGFGLTPLEAFECGCPVLSSAGGSLPEVCGDAAEIEESWDAHKWASRIESLLADSSKLSEMREKGLKRVETYSWDLTAELTEEVYKEVLR
jgi:glycosyltransferase involved in cell wall biosynthesis